MGGFLTGINRRTLAKAIRSPGRALLRMALRARLARRDTGIEHRRLVEFLSARYGIDAEAFTAEYRRSAFSEWIAGRRAELVRYPQPYRHGTTGTFGCEALYLLVRSARPSVIVETGVLYGASSGHILAALAANGEGLLYSIELGRDQWEPAHEYFVPEDLRGRWRLIIGDTRRELPGVMADCSPVDIFYHDSLHTYAHMAWEYRTALPWLAPRGLLASDDVLNPTSVASILAPGPFFRFCDERHLLYATFFNLGLAWQEQATRLPAFEA